MSDEPLTPLQLDILELETASWALPGSKISEFKRRHPNLTETAYTIALLRLLEDRRAWEYDGGLYAGTLARIQRLHAERTAERTAERAALRGVVVE